MKRPTPPPAPPLSPQERDEIERDAQAARRNRARRGWVEAGEPYLCGEPGALQTLWQYYGVKRN